MARETQAEAQATTPVVSLTRDEVVEKVQDRLAGTMDDSLDKIIAVMEEAIDGTTTEWALCPKCSSKVKADFPDWKGRKAALEMFLDRVLGKPTQRIEEKRDIKIDVDMSEMTDEQLRQIARGRHQFPVIEHTTGTQGTVVES